jgi:DNA-binding MarR family transcriptional regulator
MIRRDDVPMNMVGQDADGSTPAGGGGRSELQDDSPPRLEDELGLILDPSIDLDARLEVMVGLGSEVWDRAAAEILDAFDGLAQATRVVARRRRSAEARVTTPDGAAVMLSARAEAVLSRVCRAGGTRNYAAVAQLEGIPVPTLSRIVSGLEKAGLVEKSLHPDDRRHVQLRATTEGRRVVGTLKREYGHVLAVELKWGRPDDIAALLAAARVTESLTARVLPPRWRW